MRKYPYISLYRSLNLSGVSLFAASLLSGVCLAQANQDDSEKDDSIRWWQVEMIIFTQGNNAPSSEIWPTDINLGYPSLWQEFSPLEMPEVAGGEQTANPEQVTTALDNQSSLETDAPEPLDPTEIKLLPEEEFGLADTRKKLDRDSNRRVLFHGAWRQQMEEFQEEAPILIQAGEQFDDHYELEGSIHIYWQRLLHFDANVWLSEFSINAGQERLAWPELPTRPNIALPELELGDLKSPLSLQDKPSRSSTDLSVTTVGGDFSENGSILTNPIGGINTLNWFDQRGNTTFYDSRFDEILSRKYLVNHVVLLKQDRPMRSEELHYLDHPKLGILVNIVSWDPPIEEIEDDIDQLEEELFGPKPD